MGPTQFKEIVDDFFVRDAYSKAQNHHTLADIANRNRNQAQPKNSSNSSELKKDPSEFKKDELEDPDLIPDEDDEELEDDEDEDLK